ncbi:16S rRNA (guanine(966)-N(2))-methyltransferase RsmD [Butyrivibrio sp. MC2013]|uniref:16S rRNA (guanine(966)-N(2))-methyltransferase RsmD n=1 Tax=Butyrivibrio sp. MC2013 TaxID=1280686 RepID=UPI0003FD05D8|nr:16S rRNA (guanine(966)-N(2))-methyltransferase RsmD [Butyrivibrio sp. MC2013]
MRVIAGEARSVPLVTPEGEDTRPTQDRIKETLFNMIQMQVPGSIFIDLYSGSGSIGVEAISRGAAHAYFVDRGVKPISCITANVHKCHFDDKATIIKKDVSIALRSIHEKEADIIYIDPPYDGGLYEHTLRTLYSMPYVSEYTMIICEADINEDFSFAEGLGYEITREKLYKNNKHVFLKKRNINRAL